MITNECVRVFGRGGEVETRDIYAIHHACDKNVYAKYQCTLYTIQLVSEFVVREALPHLPAVRVSAGVFFFCVCLSRQALQ